MSAGWSLPAINEMEQDHQDLVRSASTNLDLHDALAACNDGIHLMMVGLLWRDDSSLYVILLEVSRLYYQAQLKWRETFLS